MSSRRIGMRDLVGHWSSMLDTMQGRPPPALPKLPGRVVVAAEMLAPLPRRRRRRPRPTATAAGKV